MAQKSRRAEAEKQMAHYRTVQRNKRLKGISNVKPSTDEKGVYLNLLFDKRNGRVLTPYEEEKFQRLDKIYGKH